MKKENKKEQIKKCVNHKTKPNTIVVFDYDNMPKEYHEHYPFGKSEYLLYLGEIVHMPGHGVFVNQKGKVLWGYHLDEFYIVPEEEI